MVARDFPIICRSAYVADTINSWHSKLTQSDRRLLHDQRAAYTVKICFGRRPTFYEELHHTHRAYDPARRPFRDGYVEQENTVEALTARLKALEEALQRCERLAVASRYAGATMHEINNPLEALGNLIYLAKHEPFPNIAVITYLETAEQQITSLSKIARKSLSFFKDHADGKDLDLVEIAEAALALHSQRTRRQNVEIRKQTRGPAVAHVISGEILQIVSNLILNALDALPATGAILSVRVRTCSARAHIIISDNGSGIDPEFYERMFEPNRTTKSDGTGFGLWLSRSIAEKYQGTIRCRSCRRPGQSGATFRLSIPKVLLPSAEVFRSN